MMVIKSNSRLGIVTPLVVLLAWLVILAGAFVFYRPSSAPKPIGILHSYLSADPLPYDIPLSTNTPCPITTASAPTMVQPTWDIDDCMTYDTGCSYSFRGTNKAEPVGTCDRCLHPYKIGDKVQTNKEFIVMAQGRMQSFKGVIVKIDGDLIEVCTGSCCHEFIYIGWLERQKL